MGGIAARRADLAGSQRIYCRERDISGDLPDVVVAESLPVCWMETDGGLPVRQCSVVPYVTLQFLHVITPFFHAGRFPQATGSRCPWLFSSPRGTVLIEVLPIQGPTALCRRCWLAQRVLRLTKTSGRAPSPPRRPDSSVPGPRRCQGRCFVCGEKFVNWAGERFVSAVTGCRCYR